MTKEEAEIYLYSIAGDLGFRDAENYTCKDGEKMREAIEALKQPKIGRWIKFSALAKPCCSECGKSCFGLHGFDYTISPYCPNCGAKMEESEEEHG